MDWGQGGGWFQKDSMLTTVIMLFISHLIPPLIRQQVPLCSLEPGDPRLSGQDLAAVQSQGSGGDTFSAAACFTQSSEGPASITGAWADVPGEL